MVGGWAVTSTIVFRGNKHTIPVLGPCAARTEPSLWRLLAVDTMISNPFLAGVRGAGKRRRNVRVIMTGPVDQRVMMIFSLLEVQKAIALEHVFRRMRSIFCVADAFLNFISVIKWSPPLRAYCELHRC